MEVALNQLEVALTIFVSVLVQGISIRTLSRPRDTVEDCKQLRPRVSIRAL